MKVGCTTMRREVYFLYACCLFCLFASDFMFFLSQAALQVTILPKEFLLLASVLFLFCSFFRHSKAGQGYKNVRWTGAN